MKKSEQQRLLKIVHNNYREIAAQFDVTRKKYIWPELEKVMANLEDGSSVLDVGCGNGRLLENLVDKNILKNLMFCCLILSVVTLEGEGPA